MDFPVWVWTQRLNTEYTNSCFSQDGLDCTWHESAVEHITDVMCARLRENRAIPVVEMLVVLEDRIDTTVAPNPLLEVIETVGVPFLFLWHHEG